MASHNELKGSDLHEPSNVRIMNSTGSELDIGTWVFLGVDENSSGFIPVARVAAATEKNVALIQDVNIASGSTGVARVLGRVSIDTSSFSVGDKLSLASSTTYQVSTDAAHEVAEVITSSSTGTILIDTQRIATSTTSGGATTLGGLNDVTISGITADQVIQSDSSGNWTNQTLAIPTQLTVKGTADEISVDSTTSGEVTLSTVLGPVELTSVTNKQVLEFNVDPDTDAVKLINVDNTGGGIGYTPSIEQLSDVDVVDLSDRQIIESRLGNASFEIDISPNCSTIRLQGVEDGLFFTAEDGTKLGPLRLYFQSGSANTDAYIIFSDTVIITLDFVGAITNATITSRINAALNTNWSNVTGEDDQRTISGKTVTRIGNWSVLDNPKFIDNAAATGSRSFSIDSDASETNTANFNWSITSRANGNITSQSETVGNFTVGGGGTLNTLSDLLDKIAEELNANNNFSAAYTATVTGSFSTFLTITADNAGVGDNGVFSFDITRANSSDGDEVEPISSSFSLSGGKDSVGNAKLVKWVNTLHDHVITEPNLFHNGTVTLQFQNGGHSFQNKDLVNNLSLDELANIATIDYTAIDNDFILGHSGSVANPDAWVPKKLDLDALSDANIVTPFNNQVLIYNGDDARWENSNAIPGEGFYQLTPVSNATAGLYSFTQERFDPTLYSSGNNNRIIINEAGSYEIDFAFSFSFSASTTATEQYVLEVRKNDATTPNGTTQGSPITVNDWAHGQNLTGTLFTTTEISVSSGTPHVGNASAGPIIVDLAEDDFLTLTFFYATPNSNPPVFRSGVIGIGIANNDSRKPWLRIKRVG